MCEKHTYLFKEVKRMERLLAYDEDEETDWDEDDEEEEEETEEENEDYE